MPEEGTVSLMDVVTRTELGRLDINPARLKQTQATPNYAQDTEISPDGRTLYVSRGYLGDVAAFDIASRKLTGPRRSIRAAPTTWPCRGTARTLFVSAYTQNGVRRLDAATGQVTGEVPTGSFRTTPSSPVTADGCSIRASALSASPSPGARRPPADALAYLLTIADAQTLSILDRIPFETGIRPWRFTPDETGFYRPALQPARRDRL